MVFKNYGAHFVCNLACDSYGEWSDWSECDVECGVGQKTRTRECYRKFKIENEEPTEDITGAPVVDDVEVVYEDQHTSCYKECDSKYEGNQ